MENVPKLLLAQVLTATPADTSYTVPALTTTQFSAASVTNISGAAHTVTATVTPDGASAIALVFQRTVAAGKSVNLEQVIGQVLESADKIEFSADAPAVLNLMLSGYEET